MKRLYVYIYMYSLWRNVLLSGETSIIAEWDPAGKNTITCTAWCKLIHQNVPKYRLLNGNFYQIVGELIHSTYSKSGGDFFFFGSEEIQKYKHTKTYGLGGPHEVSNLNLLTLVIYSVWSEFLWKFGDQGLWYWIGSQTCPVFSIFPHPPVAVRSTCITPSGKFWSGFHC